MISAGFAPAEILLSYCSSACIYWLGSEFQRGGQNMTAFYNIPPKGDIDDLIFAELDYEVSRR